MQNDMLLDLKFIDNFYKTFYMTNKRSEAKTIYFAGPWFTDKQMESYRAFMDLVEFNKKTRRLKYNVFFPYLFKGTPDECFNADLMAIDIADILLTWLDHKDCGTSFEMGYSKAKGKKIIVLVTSMYSLTESKTNLMLAKSADGILFVNDFNKFLCEGVGVSHMPELNQEVIE